MALETIATGVTDAPDMLIDRYLPQFDRTLIEHIVVDADVATTWDALTRLDLMQVHTPLLAAAFFVRDLPARFAVWTGRVEPAHPVAASLTLEAGAPEIEGWLSLGRAPEHEIAFGAVGRFWQPTIAWYDVQGMTPDQFAAFDDPGWGRIACNFSLRRYGARRTLASYEARTWTGDTETARRFDRYWLVVRPFVGHVMRAALDAIRDAAERRATTRAAVV